LDEFGEGIGVASGDPPLLHFLFEAHWGSPGWVVSALVILPLYHRRRGEMTKGRGCIAVRCWTARTDQTDQNKLTRLFCRMNCLTCGGGHKLGRGRSTLREIGHVRERRTNIARQRGLAFQAEAKPTVPGGGPCVSLTDQDRETINCAA